MDSGPDGWRGSPGADPPPCLASPHSHTPIPPHAGITFDSCETPSAPSLPEPRNTVCALSKPLPGVDGMPRAPKTYSPRASTSDSCETLLTPRIWLLLGGFRSYQMCWFWAVCGFWPPSWLENPHAYPDSSFDSVQTLSKGLGNVDRRGVCTLSDVRLLLGVGASTAQNDSRIDSCETGFGAEGFRSYQM